MDFTTETNIKETSGRGIASSFTSGGLSSSFTTRGLSTALSSSFTANTGGFMPSEKSGFGGWCQSVLSQSFTSTTSSQNPADDSTAGGETCLQHRQRSSSVAISSLPTSLFSSSSWTPTPALHSHFSSSSTSSFTSGDSGDDTRRQAEHDRVEKECKQVFFDAAL